MHELQFQQILLSVNKKVFKSGVLPFLESILQPIMQRDVSVSAKTFFAKNGLIKLSNNVPTFDLMVMTI